MNDVEKMLLLNKPTTCKCGSKLYYIGSGKYQCRKCDEITLDDFGKVKKCLNENGVMPIAAISQCTGVPIKIIEFLLEDGKVEISENSKYFINCQKCGCAIRSGRFCIDCAKELAHGIEKIAYNEVGERPKSADMQGKMHFLNRGK